VVDDDFASAMARRAAVADRIVNFILKLTCSENIYQEAVSILSLRDSNDSRSLNRGLKVISLRYSKIMLVLYFGREEEREEFKREWLQECASIWMI